MQNHLSVKDLAAALGISPATVWRWAAQGRLPQPRRFSPGCTRWSLDEVREWLT
ncbi:helix-turn-helix domain-containing protein [Paracoccus sp. MBLB3053]|uniref:Helix-turn-helix domain-containing protein n=1 Tax=Paracoccus aurantius TaxID=3073814 RepID=A0ABU2HRZ7_9RHOB|nr:helix-turn-helix domain-containing protein [Paracoccus sp. MBLB3053]MDS9467823.1 helix-turn-helix domain-containing protein [Paracoccus sp. MBLB3053]